MSGASETHHTTGSHVAVGDQTTMNVTYHGGLPPLPPGTPVGTRVVVRYEMIIGDASGAAAPNSEGEEQQQPQQQQQQSPPYQQQQPPQQQQQQRRHQQQPPQQQQHRPLLRPQQRSQQSTGERSQNLSQPFSEQLPQRPSQHSQQQQSPHGHQQQSGQSHLQQRHQRQGAQHRQQNHTQPRSVHQPLTSWHSVRQPQQDTSPPGQHPSSRQRLPQQQSHVSNDQLQAQRQGQPQAQGQQRNVRSTTDVRQFPKQTAEPSIGLPYSMYPISDFPDMRQEPQASGTSDPTIVENGQANSRHRPTLQRSSTDPSSDQTTRPKTLVSPTTSLPISIMSTPSDQTYVKAIPYSMNPNECPNELCKEGSIKPLTVMPKSEACSSQLPTIDTNITEDAHPPELTDIIAFKITSNPVLIVSDMANSRIKIVKSIQGVPSQAECITLPSPPIALSHFKGDNILVSYCHVMQFSFVNITKRMIEQTFKTKRQYTSFAVVRGINLAACCRQFLSVDILDLKGNIIKSYSIAQSKSPCYIYVASKIFVTDWMANTLTCIDSQARTNFIVSPSGRAVLRGLVQSGNDILVADEESDKILCFEASGKGVKVFLDKTNGICKPRGLCIHSNTLYIAEEGGLIRTWKMPEVANTWLSWIGG